MQQDEQAKTDEDLENEAFMAEMRGEEVDAQAPADEPEGGQQEADEQDEAGNESAQEEAAKAERREVIAGLTEDEIKGKLELVDKLQRALDTTNGTYGQRLAAMQQRIEELTQERQQKTDGAQQKAAQILPDRFSRLKKEFPELAELLVEDLSEVIPGQVMPDLTQFESRSQQMLDAERQARESTLQSLELRLLRRDHPDYEEVAGYTPTENGLIRWNNPAFGNWVLAQPADIQSKIINGNDAFELSDFITTFKETLKQKKTQNNLNKAIQPKGIPAARELSALDEEERAFREEMARREY